MDIDAYNVPTAFLMAVKDLIDLSVITVRGMDVREKLGTKITISHPWERCLALPERHDSFPAKCAETLWMLAGRDDIGWLSKYLPRAPQFSDNGKVWRGAYGPRLRAWTDGVDIIDQLKYVERLLANDTNSRQAVISLWNPGVDTLPGKDIPCNNWLQFLIRNRNLHMMVTQRSSDVWWGWSGIDAFSWTVLQQLMASWLNVGVGRFTHFIGSFHMYERNRQQASNVYERFMQFENRGIYDIGYSGDFCLPAESQTLEHMDKDLLLIMNTEQMARGLWVGPYGEPVSPWGVPGKTFEEQYEYLMAEMGRVESPLLKFMGQTLLVYLLFEAEVKQYPRSPLAGLMTSIMASMEFCDMWVSLAEYIWRHNPNVDLRHDDFRWGAFRSYLRKSLGV